MIVPRYFTALVYHAGHTIFCRISCFFERPARAQEEEQKEEVEQHEEEEQEN